MGTLSVAQVHKLVDLFILRMACYPLLSPELRLLFRSEGHPPLDRYTLAGLATMVPGLVVGTPSMGAIVSVAAYASLQGVISQIAHEAEVPALNFDVWCWPPERRAAFGLPPREDE